MTVQPEPTQGELLAMAYVDGELAGEERASFEARLPGEEDLARHVAHYRALDLLSRQMAPPEPADHEWARLEGEPLHDVGSKLGWGLVGVGGASLAAYGVYCLASAESISNLPKIGLLSLLGGLGLLLALTLHARVRLLPFDPYRKVKR
jgi:anti-sigma factor RsiW